MSSSTRRIVTFPAPREVEVIEEPLDAPSPDEVQVRTTASGISPGTERLIYRGDVPDDLPADPSIGALSGGLTFPIQYGYAAVGVVEAVGERVDPDWRGQRVFSFQPHVSRFVASPDDVIPLPSDVDDEEGVLIPSLETAVNFLMDARPMVGERMVVFGQGVIGLLTTMIASRFPLERLLTVEPCAGRRVRSEEMGADRSLDPADGLDPLKNELGIAAADAVEAGSDGYEGADLVVEVSGHPSVLDDAISVTGFDGRIIVGSWYGAKEGGIDLGGRFHRSRIQIHSSQVSTLDPSHRGRWSKSRRMDTVLDLLEKTRLDDLVTHTYRQQEAETAYRCLDREDHDILQPVFRYD